jgi:hypothetical protein
MDPAQVADFIFTKETMPFYLTMILSWIYANLSSTGDPADISNRVKINSAIFCGIFLGIILMIYEAVDLSVLKDYKAWIGAIFQGFLIGASAVGINQVIKNPGPVKSIIKHLELKPVKKEPPKVEPKPKEDHPNAG